MKQPAKKLRAPTLDTTFCDLTTSACEKCDTCARNISRYDIHKSCRVSVFAHPQCAFASSDCNYYLEDARKEATE